MSTRSAFTFIDEHQRFAVYKHCDGYPSGALEAITQTIPYAWKFPRFEASDFSAAFIAGNKQKGGGNIYLTETAEAHTDLTYRYEISFNKDEMNIKAYYHDWDLKCFREIFSGNLEQFESFCKTNKEH